MKSSKLLKPEIRVLTKLVDEEILSQKKRLQHTLNWIEKSKSTDPYYERDAKANQKKIAFLETLREKILNNPTTK